jgi:DNA polymerase-4
VGTPYVPRSRSRETTFQTNLTDWEAVRREIVTLAHRVADDVAAEGRPAARVAVKVRWAPFQTHTRSVTLPGPTSEAADIEAGALDALAKFEPGRAVRLLGVRAEFEQS